MQKQTEIAGRVRHVGEPAAIDDTDAVAPETPAGPETSAQAADETPTSVKSLPIEFGGRPGPEPTRYGDWEKNGRCIDF